MRGAGTERGTRTLRVATVSPEIVLGDVAGNIERIRIALRTAAAKGASLIVLPELATSGYVFTDRDEAVRAGLTRSDRVWAGLAAEIPEGVVAVVGYAELVPTPTAAGRDDVALYNSAAVFSARERIGDYRKAHLWGRESALFSAGETAGAVFQTELGRVGIAICYDSEFPEVPRGLALAGADLLVLPVNWPLVHRPESEHPPELIQAMAAARSSRIATIIADRHGEERGVSWTGGSAVIDEDGWIVATSDDSGISVVTLVLRASGDKSFPPHNDLFADRRPDLYHCGPGCALHSAAAPGMIIDSGQQGAFGEFGDASGGR
ncbi:MAG: hypothetical protein B5766_02000 [Candidatus Lumbricidophila eiseniae]|uniref:CN hydrolase domain-containing protein n=1 Tax=Candidatus Lumbricidiphila eiseniae TaxID=1969409 RepID=A0A2A6FTL2_9MICO|nr:MAG: hypothetical protein B5766_02000 [Candidatus Lumbricidophila eiseniae]